MALGAAEKARQAYGQRGVGGMQGCVLGEGLHEVGFPVQVFGGGRRWGEQDAVQVGLSPPSSPPSNLGVSVWSLCGGYQETPFEVEGGVTYDRVHIYFSPPVSIWVWFTGCSVGGSQCCDVRIGAYPPPWASAYVETFRICYSCSIRDCA